MTRARILIALALAACALATTASGATAFFKASSGKYPVTITAKGANHVFTTGGLEVKCTEAEFQGVGTGEGSQLTVRATYGTCTVTVLLSTHPATVEMDGCVYNFHQGKGEFKGDVTIECPPGQTIKIKVPFTGCLVTVGPQQVGKVKYENHGSGNTEGVIVTSEVTGIKSTNKSCLIEENTSNGEYKGAAESLGKSAGVSEGLLVV